MSLLAISFVVLAAFLHATWNLLSKSASGAGASFVLSCTAIGCVVYLPWLLWVFTTNEMVWSFPALACICVSAVIHVAYFIALQRGYQAADLSVVYPIARGTGPMLSSVGAFVLLGETPTLQGLAGLLAVVGGILLLTTEGRLAVFRRSTGMAGLRWGLLTGALIAAYTVVDGYGVKTLAIHPVMLDWFSNLVRLAVLAPVGLANPAGARERMKGHWWAALGVAVLSPAAYILVLSAIGMGAPVSLVAPAREMSMMVGAMLGMVVLREPVSAARILGCAILVGGVILLGTSR